MKDEIHKWLKDIGEDKSAELVSMCNIDMVYIDTLFELAGDGQTDLMKMNIGVPGKFYKKLNERYSNEIKVIESEVNDVAQALGLYVDSINWIPKIENVNSNESEFKISIIVRQLIFDEITLNGISWNGGLDEPSFLNRIFDLRQLPSSDSRYENADGDIRQHRINNYDWEDNWIFTDTRFNLLYCQEETLLKFLALTVNPIARSCKDEAFQLLEIYNKNLLHSGVEFYEKSQIVGKTIFSYKKTISNDDFIKRKETMQRKIALVVGCSKYEHVDILVNPLNDALAMKQELESLDFKVTYVMDPSLKELKVFIDNFGNELEAYNIGLFYFAGHGLQVKGVNYLIPTDANLKNERTVEYDCLQVDRILSHMENAKTSVNLLILDACRNNPFERSWCRGLNQRGFVVMDAPNGSLISYSTSSGKTASDGNGDNGLFTGELIAEIKTKDITITQLFQKVRKSVMDKSNNEQVPWESTSLIADFYFNKS
jgi:AbiJ N-terminal domain 3/Caspase domain